MTHHHDLIRRMAAELDHYRQLLTDDRREVHPLAVEARAALAQPEPEVVGPTDAGLEALADQFWVENSVNFEAEHYAFARAVLARWGNLKAGLTSSAPAPAGESQAAPVPVPAGEVGELVDALRADAECAEVEHYDLCNMTADQMRRAADLLEQRQAAPVPVAVSERLPGDQLCWWFEADEDCGYGSNWTLLRIRGSATGYTHWLPAHALPLPSGEVEA